MASTQQPLNETTAIPVENKRERHLRLMAERLTKIEHDFSDAKASLYQTKLETLKREMKDIQNGTHPEFVQRLRLLEKEKQNLIVKAQLWKEYQDQMAESLYQTEIQQAEQEYAVEKDGLRDRILQQIEERRRKIREEREAMTIESDGISGGIGSSSIMRTSALATGRKLRKRNQFDASGGNGSSESRSKKKQFQGPIVAPQLKDSEIMEDMVVLNKYAASMGSVSTKKFTASKRSRSGKPN